MEAKTVIGKIIEHQGVWPACYIESITCDNGKELICTREEFNQCVDEMETNYGRCDEFYIMTWQCAEKVPAPKATNSDRFPALTKTVAVPTFTQAMANEGVLPSVGMECIVYGKSLHVPATIMYISSFTVVYNRGVNAIIEDSASIDEVRFKPLTPPKTDTEKAVDDFKVFNDKELTWTHTSLIEAIKAGKIHGVTFTGKSQCQN